MSISSNVAYQMLLRQIEQFISNNERRRLQEISHTCLYKLLTPEQQRDIMSKAEAAESLISARLMHLEITPMQVPPYDRTRDEYIYYLRTLRDTVFKTDPQKAHALAIDVLYDVYHNDNIKYKHQFDEKYFKPMIFEYKRTNNYDWQEETCFGNANMRKPIHEGG